MNVVDLIVLAIFAIFIFDGFKRGAIRILIELILSIISIICAIYLSLPFGNSIKFELGEYTSINRIIAFIIAWVFIQLVLSIPYYIFLKKYPNLIDHNILNKVIGAVVTTIKFGVLFILFFAVINAIPYSNENSSGSIVFDQLNNSSSNKILGKIGQPISNSMSDIFKELYSNGFSQTGQGPIIGEKTDLGFKYNEGKVDYEAEQKIFTLLNKERSKSGLPMLVWDEKLAELAREHSQDMLKRGYFSHNTPEGYTPFDRMAQKQIKFIAAGENLAFALTVEAAHQGLMLSTGHRANILSKDYQNIGIGVINAGKYGEMFTQTFASYNLYVTF